MADLPFTILEFQNPELHQVSPSKDNNAQKLWKGRSETHPHLAKKLKKYQYKIAYTANICERRLVIKNWNKQKYIPIFFLSLEQIKQNKIIPIPSSVDWTKKSPDSVTRKPVSSLYITCLPKITSKKKMASDIESWYHLFAQKRGSKTAEMEQNQGMPDLSFHSFSASKPVHQWFWTRYNSWIV